MLICKVIFGSHNENVTRMVIKIEFNDMFDGAMESKLG